MAELRVFSLKQVSTHKSKEDCWFVIGGKVYNVTKFLQEHPGGEEVLVEASGRDATRDFEDVGHSPAAKGMLDNYLVGVLEGFKGVVSVNKQSTTPSSKQDKPAFKDMPAFVIKEEKPSTFIRVIEFLVPLVIVGATFLFKSAMKEPVLSS